VGTLPDTLVASASFANGAEDAEGSMRVALAAAYEELAPAVHRFLRDMLGDATLAADGTQETFVRAYRQAHRLDPGTRLGAWVFGISRNVSLELRKARGRTQRVMTGEGPSPDVVRDPRTPSPEAELLQREALTVVTRALERLPDERRAALLLRLDHGLAYEEIAGLMGWSMAKTKVEIFRARELLRAVFEEYRGGSS
jgi:RNA polymerase sigma-70 factor (ECF subfamily)